MQANNANHPYSCTILLMAISVRSMKTKKGQHTIAP